MGKGVRPPNAVPREPNAVDFIKQAAEELQRRLKRRDIRIEPAVLRAKLTEALLASAVGSKASIAAMALHRYATQTLIQEVEAKIAANLAEGRSRGGLRGSETYREKRRARAALWWTMADGIDGSLRHKARIIALRQRNLGIDAPTELQVYDALRRYRPKKLT